MLALAVVMRLTLGAAPMEVSAPVAADEQPWIAWAGLSPGFRTGVDAGQAQGWIGLSRAVNARLRPELDVGLGYAGGPAELLTSMRLGVNFEFHLGRATPFLWLAFAHNHEDAIDDVKHDPLPAVLGLSENGVVHRTGADGGGGIRLDLGAGRSDEPRASLGLRSSATAFLGDGPAVSLNLLAFLGVAF